MKTTLIACFMAILIGCSATPADKPISQSPAATPIAVRDSIPFPVFMSFAEFEPLLHLSNDTTYVVNFWATWCKPCVEELPFFEKLIAETANQPIKVLLVSMDFPKDFLRKLVPFVAERKLQRHVVALGDLDYDAWIGKVSEAWDGAIPFTLVYNKKSRAVKNTEFADYTELSSLVSSVLD